jgi:serine/threonine protein kinase
MGVVYRARDPLLNRDVAVKLISSTDLTSELEERFQREAQSLWPSIFRLTRTRQTDLNMGRWNAESRRRDGRVELTQLLNLSEEGKTEVWCWVPWALAITP